MGFPLEEKYKIEGTSIRTNDVKRIIEETIKECKRKYPNRVEDINKIEINYKLPGRYKLSEGDLIILFILVKYFSPIAIETWREIVIPLLKKKLKIEPYNE